MTLQKSTQNCELPSFYWTVTIGLAQALVDGFTTPRCCMSSIICAIFSRWTKGVLYEGVVLLVDDRLCQSNVRPMKSHQAHCH